MSLPGVKNQREILRQQFELISPNVKNILRKDQNDISYYQREILVNLLKKVIFIREGFANRNVNFTKMTLDIELGCHQKGQVVFLKGEEGTYFYIVLDGSYSVQSEKKGFQEGTKSIYYYPGDSFGEVSLIYDVPRGATIISEDRSYVVKIPKNVFNAAGNIQKTLKRHFNFFNTHVYFENQSQFMVRVVSSLSKSQKFVKNEVIIDTGQPFNELLFFLRGEAKVFKTLKLQNSGFYFDEIIQIATIVQGQVFGEKFYLSKLPSGVKIVGVEGNGQYIKVAFKDNVNTIDSPLYKRIRQNANQFPSDHEILDQYKGSLNQRLRQLQYLTSICPKNKKSIECELRVVRAKFKKIEKAKLIR